LIIAAFALAFLHYEIARKTSWPERAKPGKRLYSAVVGPVPAVALAVALAVASVAIMVALLRGHGWSAWIPLAALVPALAGAARFAGSRRATMTPFAMAF